MLLQFFQYATSGFWTFCGVSFITYCILVFASQVVVELFKALVILIRGYKPNPVYVSPKALPVPMTPEFEHNVCLSYRHGFDMMDKDEHDALRYQFKEWARAINNNLTK